MSLMDKATILIIDDNPTNLRVFLEELEQAGFKALVAPSGERALQQLEHLQPDLILLDVLMPGIDGFETCERLKKHKKTRDIPVIFMTALSDTVDKLRGFEVGGVDYMTKPFYHKEAIARITTHLTIRRLQQQLEEQNAQLRELNASKDKFLSLIAHDLQSPFSSLQGLIQFTVENIDGWSKSQIEKTLELLGSSTEHLYALIKNLMTWSRIQRGVLEYHPQQFDMQEIVSKNIVLLGTTAKQKNITLTSSVQEKLLVYGDTNMIDAVVRNLISNALKFTYPGGKVNVSVTQNGQDVEVAVQDTGIGISREDMNKLFRIDKRYKQLGTSHEKGTGLGLILCKEFLEKNGGKLWLTSEISKGSTFFFTLPKSPTNS